MRSARFKALVSPQRMAGRGFHQRARLARAVIDTLERRVLFAGNIIHVDVTLDEDNMMMPFANSLRAAIIAANATPGSTIEFSGLTFDAQDSPTQPNITLNDDLSNVPITAAGTIIDGTTAPDAEHRVVIDGTGKFDGLDIQAPNVTIKGLSFINLGMPASPGIPGAAITLDAGSSNDLIVDDYFGVSGVANAGNGPNDIDIDVTNGSTGDTIGGTSAADRNIIGGATGDNGNNNRSPLGIGVDIEDPAAMGTTGIVVEGNYIGTDITGENALPNINGVELQDVTGITIQNNLISGNTNNGIAADDPLGTSAEFGNTILDNTIGLDAMGTTALGNGTNGILLEGGSLTGGPGMTPEGDTVTGNTIEHNTGNGVNIQQTLWTTTPSPMYSGGMYNQIVSNTIISNGDTGIVVNRGSEANTISQNSISLNGIIKGGTHQLGIDLSNLNGTNNVNSFNEDGLTLNSTTSGTGVGASGTGGNGLTPYPILGPGPIVIDSGNTNMYKVPVEMEGNPGPMGMGTSYKIELFANPPSALGFSSGGQNYGEGAIYLGSVQVVTTTANQFVTGASFDIPKSFGGDFISATATDISPLSAEFNPAAGGTSEFSPDVVVPGIPIPTVAIGNMSAVVGTNLQFPITLSNATNLTVSVPYSFVAGTAPLTDFNSASGTLTIPPNTTNTTISVAILGDATLGTEQFTIILGTPTNATLADFQSTEAATGTITPNTGTTASTTTLTASPTPVKTGATVTLTATVTATAGGTATIPTGLVDFILNNVSIGTGNLNASGQAQLTTTTLPVGLDQVTAIYAGDTTYATSRSSTVVDVRNPIVTTLTLIASPTTSPFGTGNVLFTATISPGNQNPPPTGNVNFILNGQIIGTSSGGVFSNANAYFATTALPQGADSITASYPGNSLYNGSTSNAVVVIVVAPPSLNSSITVTPSATAVEIGTSVTLTAQVTPGTGPTGSVSFFDNGTPIGSGTLQSNGTAVFTATSLPAGVNSITADYSGDTNYKGSTSAAATVTVAGVTSMALTESNALVYVGESITLTAQLTFVLTDNTAPTGTITFIENNANLEAPVPVPANGQVVLVVTPPTGGGTITAVYSGDSIYVASTSPPVSQTVIAAPNSVTTLSASKKLLDTVGDPVTLTASVSSIPAGGATPTGTVTFNDGSIVLGTTNLDGNGVATLVTTELFQGRNTVTATYNGSSTYTSSLPAHVNVDVNGPGLLPIKTVTGLTSAVAGTTIHAPSTITLMNPNPDPAIGVGTLNLYASTDGTVDDSSMLINSLVINTLKVKSGKSIAVKDMISQLPTGLPSGSYTLLALMMSPSGIEDFSSSGPSFSVAAPFISLSESLSTRNFGPNVVSGASTKGSVKLVVTNHGNVTASGLMTFNITASPTAGVVGTTIVSVTEKETIAKGKSKTITIPLGDIPALASGQYDLVAQVTDPNGGISVATSPTAYNIAPAFVSLSAAFTGSSSVLSSGASVVVTNNGNVDDVTELDALMGFSTSSTGTPAVPEVSTSVFTKSLTIKAGKSVTIHLDGWKSLVLGLSHGVQYFATVTLTDATDNSAFAVDSSDVITV